jgi:hypothetical protein
LIDDAGVGGRTWIVFCVLVACGPSNSGNPASPARSRSTQPAGPSAAELEAARDREERVRREGLAEAHRKLTGEQQDALAASCDEPRPGTKNDRCLPSCYQTEAPDARAGKKLVGAHELQHTVCQRVLEDQQYGPLMVVDELDSARLRIAAFPRKFPAAHKQGSWQATVETWFRDEQSAKLPRGDTAVVAGGWRNLTHPLTHERLRCVTLSHYARSLRQKKLGECGPGLGITCEAAGNGAARAINVVRYRLAEAKKLQGSGKTTECQQAALEAIAVAYGLPRWRQYKKLNVAEWKDNLLYKTRFDGVLDEDTLFSTVATLGTEAATVYTECGGPARAKTTPQQEQSFHTCW